jgi:uncharacterized protein (TIGR00730 family)
MAIRSVCVYCGSRPGNDASYAAAAVVLAQELARRDITLVYGGASVGVMGILADAALGAGGRVVGVIPRLLRDKELAHNGLSELHLVDSMHERKAKMADLADAFIALPGGFGTFEEIFEVITWAQLGLHHKPIGFLNLNEFYRELFRFIDGAVAAKFIPDVHHKLFVERSEPIALVDALFSFVAPEHGDPATDRRVAR